MLSNLYLSSHNFFCSIFPDKSNNVKYLLLITPITYFTHFQTSLNISATYLTHLILTYQIILISLNLMTSKLWSSLLWNLFPVSSYFFTQIKKKLKLKMCVTEHDAMETYEKIEA
jgi:hypothetical protein